MSDVMEIMAPDLSLLIDIAKANLKYVPTVFNVMGYGAKGDGIKDDSAAVLATITAAAGAPVYFPPGTYDLTAMTGVGGRVNFISFGGAVIKGFYYKELSAPQQGNNAVTNETDAYFRASNITFQGVGTRAGLKIENQSQGTFIRSMDLYNCTFRGQVGLETVNVLDSTIINATFIGNQYGWKALSNTNITVSNAKFFGSSGYAVYIDRAPIDTFNRYGGESIKFDNCQWFDLATAIQAINHNNLTLDNCMIDYVNMGVYLHGCKYAKILGNTYIGYTAGSRYGGALGIAPTKTGCVYAEGDQTLSFTSSVNLDHSIFVGYSDAASDLVKLDGTTVTFGGIENCSITDNVFQLVGSTPTTQYELNINKSQDVVHTGNRYYSNNNQVLAPWLFATMTRLFSERNDFANCLNASSVNKPPASGNIGNQVYEAAKLTVTGNGTKRTGNAQYIYKNAYAAVPFVVASVNVGGTYAGSTSDLCVAVISKDSTTCFVDVTSIDAAVIANGVTIDVNIIVMGF